MGYEDRLLVLGSSSAVMLLFESLKSDEDLEIVLEIDYGIRSGLVLGWFSFASEIDLFFPERWTSSETGSANSGGDSWPLSWQIRYHRGRATFERSRSSGG
jgi:hypothetical protein